MKRKTADNPLGMRDGWLYESIMTTYSGKDAHAAPIGVRFASGHLELEVYKTAETCRNLAEKKAFAANYSDDATLFYRSLYDRRSLTFRKAGKVDAPRLRGAEACIEAEVVGSKDMGKKVFYRAKIIHVRKWGLKHPVMNRAGCLLMECLVKATKAAHVDRARRKELREEVKRICRTIAKVAPASDEERLSKKILSSSLWT